MTARNPDRGRLRLVSILLVALALASLAVLGWREVEVRRSVFARITADRGEASTRDVQAFFGPLEKQLSAIRGWGEGGDLAWDRVALDARFTPVLRSQPALAALALGGEEGLEYEIDRSPDGVQSRFVRNGGLDHKDEEWYRLAVEDPTGTVHWNAFTDRDDTTGVSLRGSVGWVGPPPLRLARAASVGIAPAALDSLIERLQVTENGLIALVSSDGTTAWAMPGQAPRFRPVDAGALLHPVDGPVRLLAEALYLTSHELGPEESTRRFRYDGQAWWVWRGGFGRGPIEREIVLALPESDLSARFQTVTSPLTYGLLLLLLVCVFLLFRLALRWRRRLGQVVDRRRYSNADEAELRELIRAGEGERLEFKSTLRWNLERDRPAREIELAWLKTVVAFLNTEGGTLLVGVRDDGRVMGVRRDQLGSGDRFLLKVNELVQKYVGVEYAQYLSYALRPVGEEKILVMDVLPAREPAFLRTADDDMFYVRMGPASRRLNTRRTLEYLRDFDRR